MIDDLTVYLMEIHIYPSIYIDITFSFTKFILTKYHDFSSKQFKIESQ